MKKRPWTIIQSTLEKLFWRFVYTQTKTNTKATSLTCIPCMQDSHRETSLSQLSNGMMMSMNKPQESGKIALNTRGTWTIGAVQWLNHIECVMGQSHGNWLKQKRLGILCALVSNGNFTELSFTDWQIKKLSWVSETEWLNQYHSMLLSNLPRTLLAEPASTSVRDMTGLAPPRVFSSQNKKTFHHRVVSLSCRM